MMQHDFDPAAIAHATPEQRDALRDFVEAQGASIAQRAPVESSRAARKRKLKQDREAAVSEVLRRYPLMTPDRATQLANDVSLCALLTQPPDWSPLIQRAKVDIRAQNTGFSTDILDFVAVESVLVTAIFSAYFETFHEYPIA